MIQRINKREGIFKESEIEGEGYKSRIAQSELICGGEGVLKESIIKGILGDHYFL